MNFWVITFLNFCRCLVCTFFLHPYISHPFASIDRLCSSFSWMEDAEDTDEGVKTLIMVRNHGKGGLAGEAYMSDIRNFR